MIFYVTTRGWCLTPEARALQPWIQKVKKNEKEETKGPPQKMLCTPYEKQLKKMPGDLTMLKDILVWWSIIYFSINLATPQKAPASPSRMCFWPHVWDSSWTGGATPKCFAFLLLSLLDGFPCKSNLKHTHVLDSLVSVAFDVRTCSIRCGCWKLTLQCLRVSCIQVMLCARPCLEAIMRFQWPTQWRCNPGSKNMLRCVLQRVVKLPSKKSAVLQLWSYSESLMYVILLFTFFKVEHWQTPRLQVQRQQLKAIDAEMDGDVVKIPIIALVCLACMAQVVNCCCWENKLTLNALKYWQSFKFAQQG